TSIKTKVNSSDVDGSEKVYVDIRKAELSEASAVLDVGGKTEIIQIKQSDSAGRAITFLSSATTGGNVSDLVKSGTGTAQVEITQGSNGVKEVAEVIFNNLSAGKTIGFAGLLFTAGSSGASATQIAEAFASKAAGFAAGTTAVTGGVLSGTLSGWGTGAKETVWYRVDTNAVQSVDVIAPSTTAKPISIFLRPTAIDSGAGLTATSNISPTVQSLTIPFEDRPATPSLTVIPTATGLEDQATLFLSQFIKVDPAVGRSLDTVTVFTRLDNTMQLVSANGTQLIKSTKTGFTDYYEVAATNLSTTRIKTPENFKGAITSKTFARDTASNGLVADTAKDVNDGNSTFNISAVADGVNIASGVLAVDLNVGVEAKLYDPANPAASFFSKISLKDSSESFVAKLVFKNTPADALIIKVAGKLVLGQAEVTDGVTNLVYSFTQAQLSSTNVNDSITILAKNGLFGKSVELQGVSNDLTSASEVVKKDVTVNLSATAVAPDVSLSSARGNEDSAISLPVKVAINPERTSFEKIGFEITLNSTGTTNTNDAQNAVSILSTGKFKVGTDEFIFTNGKWVVHNNSAQLNFDNLTFTPPANYSGKVVFNFKSFSQTSSGSKTYASETPVTVTVDPVAETVVFKAATAITGVEDQAAINFAISNYFDKTKLTDLGETVNIEISIASAITLKKGGTNIIPTSNAAGVSTYVLAVDVDKWDDSLAGYQLVLANNFASDATNGANAIVAGRRISLKATAFEQSGETATPQILSIDLTISPVADKPDSPRLLREAITLNESQASDHTWFDAKEAIKLSSLISSDASETLSVQITAANSLVLILRNGDAFTAISSTAKAIGASSTVYTLTPVQYESLVLRGDNYASGNADFKVKVISTESWGGSTAASNELGAVFTLKPIASG
ncbi:MAG: hypothetical protein EBR60_10430, partial [Burkholderiaceae bacterium]|nr:hypothetical protein [Burkholderiaceae bacterium]